MKLCPFLGETNIWQNKSLHMDNYSTILFIINTVKITHIAG